MQITSQSSKAISTNLEPKNSENQNIEFICQELKNICTISYQLICPKISQKSIKKKKIIKQMNKNNISKQETREEQNNESIPNCQLNSLEDFKFKIALIEDLQQKLLFIKMMISKI